jgi:hypothetical protein
MKTNCLIRLALVATAIMLTVNTLAADKGKPLFNGRDLEGWVKVHDVDFQVVDGNLRLVKGMGWLRTEQEYANFVLEFEWRALQEKYDSGIFFRAGLEGKPWPDKSYQVNLRYDMLGGLVRGFTPLVPAETPRLPLNQWVKFRLEVKGNKVTLDVDGERAWETDKVEPGRGFIGIQAEDRSFDFRNFQIEDLGAS